VPQPTSVLRVVDAASAADLSTYVLRASRLDPGGSARVLGVGDVLAVYVCPLTGGGGPTVLGLRTTRLREPADVDVVVPLAALADRLARPENGTDVPVPPVEQSAAWAGISPPRTGWEAVAAVPAPVLVQAAEAGIAEVAAGTPTTSGAPAVAALRGRVWGRPVPGHDVPSGAAFAAHGLAFVRELDPPVEVRRSGPWTRLTTPRGHVLARAALL
jgi:hypothetical protein